MDDNVRTWQAWAMVSDQWRVGMEVVGFDLPGAASYLRQVGLGDPETLVKLRAISQKALDCIRLQRDERKKAKVKHGRS